MVLYWGLLNRIGGFGRFGAWIWGSVNGSLIEVKRRGWVGAEGLSTLSEIGRAHV